jgi:hypothetical protein
MECGKSARRECFRYHGESLAFDSTGWVRWTAARARVGAFDSTNIGPESLAFDSTGWARCANAFDSTRRAWLSIAQSGYDGLLHEREQMLSIARISAREPGFR